MCVLGLNFQKCHWLSSNPYNSLYIEPEQCKCHLSSLQSIKEKSLVTLSTVYFLFCFVSDDTKDTDSLSDEVTHNSNQNNSNCSSPSRMSDSVSLNTDSSQDTSLCSPVKQTHIAINAKIRFVNERLNRIIYLYNRDNKASKYI